MTLLVSSQRHFKLIFDSSYLLIDVLEAKWYVCYLCVYLIYKTYKIGPSLSYQIN